MNYICPRVSFPSLSTTGWHSREYLHLIHQRAGLRPRWLPLKGQRAECGAHGDSGVRLESGSATYWLWFNFSGTYLPCLYNEVNNMSYLTGFLLSIKWAKSKELRKALGTGKCYVSIWQISSYSGSVLGTEEIIWGFSKSFPIISLDLENSKVVGVSSICSCL